MKKTRIPDDQSSVNTFSIIGDELQEQLRTIFDEKPQPNDPKPFTLAKNLFAACMNTSKHITFRQFYFILQQIMTCHIIFSTNWKSRRGTVAQYSEKTRRMASIGRSFVERIRIQLDGYCLQNEKNWLLDRLFYRHFYWSGREKFYKTGYRCKFVRDNKSKYI